MLRVILTVFITISHVISADLFEDLKNVIDEVNTMLSDESLAIVERQFLQGRAEGLFTAVEIIRNNGSF
jgi:hypothetical protein